MKSLIIEATRKYSDGLIEVDVLVDRKKTYTFIVGSQFMVNRAEKLSKINAGATINYLKKVNLKEDEK